MQSILQSKKGCSKNVYVHFISESEPVFVALQETQKQAEGLIYMCEDELRVNQEP